MTGHLVGDGQLRPPAGPLVELVRGRGVARAQEAEVLEGGVPEEARGHLEKHGERVRHFV